MGFLSNANFLLTSTEKIKIYADTLFYFQVQKNKKNYGEFIKHKISGHPIDVNSIRLLPQAYTAPDQQEKIESYYKDIGYDLNSCQVLSGLWYDGWAENSIEFVIHTGSSGIMQYYIDHVYTDENVNLFKFYINGRIIEELAVDPEMEMIEIPVLKNAQIHVKVEADSYFYLTQEWERSAFTDAIYHRKLAYKLCNIICE